MQGFLTKSGGKYADKSCAVIDSSVAPGGIAVYPRIRDLRTDRDLNQTQVAKMLGMSQTGYSKYETGENDVPTQVLIQLARFYDTSIDYLLGETNERRRYPKPRT